MSVILPSYRVDLTMYYDTSIYDKQIKQYDAHDKLTSQKINYLERFLMILMNIFQTVTVTLLHEN